MRNLFTKLRNAFGENYFLSSVVIFFLCVSSAYQYIQYSHHLDNAKRDLTAIHQEYQHIRWETIKSIIGVVNREGKLHSSLVSHILSKRISNEYSCYGRKGLCGQKSLCRFEKCTGRQGQNKGYRAGYHGF